MVNISAQLLEKYNRAVPRYTSYPTAPHFRHELTSLDMERLLKNQPLGTRYSLYFHIPFCRKLCSYCGCFTRIVDHEAPVKSYVESLIKEIGLAGRAAGYKPQVSHIHFGGGSPNLLDAEDLSAIFEAMNENFGLEVNAEIAMEMDPRTLTPEKVTAFADTGFNRASLGVQDFQPDVQKAVNRIQPYEKVADCVQWLRDAGIKAVNFDLMYGLPLQTVEGIEDNVMKAVSLKPDRFALFGYAHVPWMKPHQEKLEAFHLPDTSQRMEQCEAATKALEANGYKTIGMDHFAKETDPLYQAYCNHTLKRNFQGYTTDNADVLLGFGISAISRFPQAYIQNTTSFKDYKEDISCGVFPVLKGCLRSDDDRLRHDVIEQFMCYFEVDVKALCQRHGLDPAYLKDAVSDLDDMINDGLIEKKGYQLQVTDLGRLFIRTICARFDAYFNETVKRHVKAV